MFTAFDQELKTELMRPWEKVGNVLGERSSTVSFMQVPGSLLQSR